jgi:two-component system, OmpR family, phosphate regulon response regulator OmpR
LSNEEIKVLIIDDDAELRQLLVRYLEENAIYVRAVENGDAMRRLLAREHFDVLVLDLMLPKEDGLTILRSLRAEKNLVPVLMLTARGQDVDRIIGIEMGADDYMAKPYNPRELLARIRAMVRRQAYFREPGAPERGKVVEFGEYCLDLESRTLTKSGELITLSTGEFSLLKAFAAYPMKPLSREHLLNLSRTRDSDVSDRSVDLQILRLRRLIEADPSTPRYIQTVWGFGYVFVPTGERK